MKVTMKAKEADGYIKEERMGRSGVADVSTRSLLP
jgi:hypothetical protein